MNHYKNVLEALHRTGRKSTIRNMLVKSMVHSDDARLRSMVEEVVHRLDASSTNTGHTPVSKMRSVNARDLVNYCERMRGRAKG